MPRKTFEAGMEAGAKPFEEKFQKQADATVQLGKHIDNRLDQIDHIVSIVLDDLSDQERKQIYALNSVVDIAQLDETEKEYLCAIIYGLANLNTTLTKEQKVYLRALKTYLKVINVQPAEDFSSIENIESITTQKAILQTIMEFLFLEYQNHSYVEDYADILEHFSVNRKSILEIQSGIDTLFKTVGLGGIAEHYGAHKPTALENQVTHSQEELDLYAQAADAFLHYDIAKAFQFFSLLADRGDSRSCYFLGFIYANGSKGVVLPDNAKALEFWKRGMAAGESLCALRVAENTDDTEKQQEIYASALDDALSLAEDGNIYAMFEIGRAYGFAYEPLHDEEKAIYWYAKASDLGSCSAANNLGQLYSSQGKSDQSVEQYKKAIHNGHELAMYNMAVSLFETGCDEKAMKKLLCDSAESGFSNAMIFLGAIAEDACDYEGATIWYQKALKRGDSAAYYPLARAMSHLKNIKYEPFDGIQFTSSASLEVPVIMLINGALCGHQDATIELAGRVLLDNTLTIIAFFDALTKCHLSGTFPGGFILGDNNMHAKTAEWAISYLQKQVAEGSLTAQYYLGMNYVNRFKNEKNIAWKEKACELLDMATEQISDQIKNNNSDNASLGLHILDVQKRLDKKIALGWPSAKTFVNAD